MSNVIRVDTEVVADIFMSSHSNLGSWDSRLDKQSPYRLLLTLPLGTSISTFKNCQSGLRALKTRNGGLLPKSASQKGASCVCDYDRDL